MKTPAGISTLLCAVLCLFTGPSVKADTLLFTNGPINGTLDAGGISQGRGPLSDSFTVGGNSALTLAVVGLWLSPGDTPVAVDWEIGTTQFGSDIASGTSSFFDQTNMGPNAADFDIWQSSLDIGGTVHAGTTYWFSLSNATTILPSAATTSFTGMLTMAHQAHFNKQMEPIIPLDPSHSIFSATQSPPLPNRAACYCLAQAF